MLLQLRDKASIGNLRRLATALRHGWNWWVLLSAVRFDWTPCSVATLVLAMYSGHALSMDAVQIGMGWRYR